MEERGLSRREFLRESVLATIVGIGHLIPSKSLASELKIGDCSTCRNKGEQNRCPYGEKPEPEASPGKYKSGRCEFYEINHDFHKFYDEKGGYGPQAEKVSA